MNKFDLQTKIEDVRHYHVTYDPSLSYSPFKVEFIDSLVAPETKRSIESKVSQLNKIVSPVLEGMYSGMAYNTNAPAGDHLQCPPDIERFNVMEALVMLDELGIDRNDFMGRMLEDLIVTKFKLAISAWSLLRLRNSMLIDHQIMESSIRDANSRISALESRIQTLENNARSH